MAESLRPQWPRRHRHRRRRCHRRRRRAVASCRPRAPRPRHRPLLQHDTQQAAPPAVGALSRRRCCRRRHLRPVTLASPVSPEMASLKCPEARGARAAASSRPT
eukprot:83096-Chlamydomonas_euryale.AAC.1